jgi:type VI secretion system protein ImpH
MISPLEALRRTPKRFRFGAAVRLLWLAAATGDAGDAIRFAASASLAQPAAEIEAARPGEPAKLVTGVIGLTGPSSVMPRWYTEILAQSRRGGAGQSSPMAAFFDLLAQRIIAGFAMSGVKYRPHLATELAFHAKDDDAGRDAPDPLGAALLALTGYGTAHLADRLAIGPAALQHYAGFFTARPRSADRLAAMASDWLGRRVEVREFAGAWLVLGPDQQSRMPRGRHSGQFHQLGVDCAAGARAFDQQARFILRIGPLSCAEFEALLPDRTALKRFVSLVRAYVGLEADFAVNLVLDPAEIPPLALGAVHAPRLGWTAWLPAPAARLTGRKPADEALFSAALVEAAKPEGVSVA